jgi:hypothetical protein
LFVCKSVINLHTIGTFNKPSPNPFTRFKYAEQSSSSGRTPVYPLGVGGKSKHIGPFDNFVPSATIIIRIFLKKHKDTVCQWKSAAANATIVYDCYN